MSALELKRERDVNAARFIESESKTKSERERKREEKENAAIARRHDYVAHSHIRRALRRPARRSETLRDRSRTTAASTPPLPSRSDAARIAVQKRPSRYADAKRTATDRGTRSDFSPNRILERERPKTRTWPISSSSSARSSKDMVQR